MSTRFVLLALFLLAQAVPAQADKGGVRTAGALFAAMQQARYHTDFSGVLVYGHGPHMQAVRIRHRLHGGTEQEQLQVLDGEVREIVRHDALLVCLFPDGRVQWLRSSEGSGWRDGLQHVRPELIDRSYHLRAVGTGRQVGRSADKYMVMPVDSWRYGYLLWVDRESGLMLKVQTVDHTGEVIEQLRFSELDLQPEFPPNAFHMPPAPVDVTASGRAPPRESPALLWEAGWLPPGFVAVRPAAAAEGSRSRQYSDGLAVFSLFTEALDERALPEGQTVEGATHALTRHRQLGRQRVAVTAVGEVPYATLEAVINGLIPLQPESSP